MAIIGTHLLIYTAEAEALRDMFRDAFGFKSIDAGGGWLIFSLPPAEIGIHPSEGPAGAPDVHHQISIMCDDLEKTVAQLRSKGVQFAGEPAREQWGIRTMMNLPGGARVMLYQPLHPLAISPAKPKAAKRGAARPAKRTGKARRKAGRK